jgi:hypothetical protein
VREGPGTAGVLRDQYSFVVTYCHTSCSVAETNARQQRPCRNDIRLNPRAAIIVTQQDMTALSHSNEPLAGGCNIEKQCAGRQTCGFGEIPGANGQRGNRSESRGRQMPRKYYRTPLICSALGW